MSTPTQPGSIAVTIEDIDIKVEGNGTMIVEGLAGLTNPLFVTEIESLALYQFFRHTPGVATIIRRAFLELQHTRHCWVEGTKDESK